VAVYEATIQSARARLVPEITHTVTAAGTIWQLPIEGAMLQVTTTEERCAIAH
jgi:hypothetical protein